VDGLAVRAQQQQQQADLWRRPCPKKLPNF
jgi:hypothetical protein